MAPFIQTVLTAMVNHQTKSPANFYFESKLNGYPLCAHPDSDWFLSIELGFLTMKPVLHRGRYSSIEVPLTKAEKKALVKAYNTWLSEEKESFRQRQHQARY